MAHPPSIKLARRYAALTQAQLAQAVDVQRSAVSHWESPLGKNPTVKHLRKIAHVTGVKFEWLATGRGPMAVSDDMALDSVAAAHALLVEDDLEMRMVHALRKTSQHARLLLVEMAEQLAVLRTGRARNHPTPKRRPRSHA